MSEAHWRRTARATVELTAHFRRDEPGAALEKAGRITDLGMGGAFVHTQRPPSVGTRIVLTLAAPTAWDPLEVPAEVRWVAPAADAEAGFGVRFVTLSPTQASALHELVAASGFASDDDDQGHA